MTDLTDLALRTADMCDLAIKAAAKAESALSVEDDLTAKQAVDHARLLAQAVHVFARDLRIRARAVEASIAVQAATARTLTFADMAVQSVEAFAVATWADDMGQCPVPLCTQAELAAEAVRDAQSTRLFADLAAVVTEEERV